MKFGGLDRPFFVRNHGYTESGKATYYEAKFTLNGKKLEVKVDPDGKLISMGDVDD
jgi:hypothetical protein